LHRRLRNCLIGMRAETYPDDAPEIVTLEFYLAWRARGLVMENPGSTSLKFRASTTPALSSRKSFNQRVIAAVGHDFVQPP
jgi:hypothetical protein